MTDSHDYNLGYEEAREMVMEVIEEMRDSGKYFIPTLRMDATHNLFTHWW